MLQPRDPQVDRVPEPSRPDPATSVSAALLGVAALGLFLGAILAVYDWKVPGAEMPLFFGVLSSFAAAVLVQVVAVTVRHLRTGGR
jgi:hypothetical protein